MLLSLVTQRVLLLAVAFVALNQAIPSSRRPGSVLPQIHPASVLWNRMLDRVAETPESTKLAQLMQTSKMHVFTATYNPFMWICRWVVGLTGIPPIQALIIVSNIFLLLFLWELHALFNRMVTEDTAAAATILVVLWPTTYEMSLGSTLAMSCFFIVLCLRNALDDRWLVTGIALGGLALVEPLALGMLPLVLFLFWYFQRHFPVAKVVRSTLYFLVPAGIAIGWRIHGYAHLSHILSDSALFNFASAMKGMAHGAGIARSFGGQTVAILFFGVGAVCAFLSNTTLAHRLIPLNMFLLLILFSPYSQVASRAPIAAVCLEGIASVSSRATTRIVQLVMLGLGAYEVFSVFA